MEGRIRERGWVQLELHFFFWYKNKYICERRAVVFKLKRLINRCLKRWSNNYIKYVDNVEFHEVLKYGNLSVFVWDIRHQNPLNSISGKLWTVYRQLNVTELQCLFLVSYVHNWTWRNCCVCSLYLTYTITYTAIVKFQNAVHRKTELHRVIWCHFPVSTKEIFLPMISNWHRKPNYLDFWLSG